MANFQSSKFVFASAKRRDDICKQMPRKLLPNGVLQDWKLTPLPEAHRMLYAKSLALPALEFFFSFEKKDVTSSQSSEFFFKAAADALGTAISNIDNAPIDIAALHIQNYMDNVSAL
jgi:hypothetical protein